MRRRRPWIGLAALLALGGCSMGPPSPSDDGLGGGSSPVIAPDPVAVPAGTPEAPRPIEPPKPAEVIPPATAPAPDPSPPATAPNPPPAARQPLRLPLPALDDSASGAIGARRRPSDRPASLALGDGSPVRAGGGKSPSIGMGTVSAGLPAPHRSPSASLPSARAAGFPFDGASSRVGQGAGGVATASSARLAVPEVSPLANGAGVSPGITLGSAAVPASGVSAAPRAGVSTAQEPQPVVASPLRLDVLPNAGGAGVAPADAAQLVVWPAAAIPASSPSPSPGLGEGPASSPTPPAVAVSPGIRVSSVSSPQPVYLSEPAPALRPDAAAAPASSAATVITLVPRAVGGSTVPPVAGRVSVGLQDAAPGARSGAASSLPSGAIVNAAEADGDAAARREAELHARETERQSHGTGLRRWLQDHFPFLF